MGAHLPVTVQPPQDPGPRPGPCSPGARSLEGKMAKNIGLAFLLRCMDWGREPQHAVIRGTAHEGKEQRGTKKGRGTEAGRPRLSTQYRDSAEHSVTEAEERERGVLSRERKDSEETRSWESHRPLGGNVLLLKQAQGQEGAGPGRTQSVRMREVGSEPQGAQRGCRAGNQ